MDEQRAFDEEARRGLSRRDFLVGATRASAAAMLLGATSCAMPFVRRKPAPGLRVFTNKEAQVVAKLVDGFVPPTLSIRQALKEEDPDYDPVQRFEEFVYPYGDDFVGNIRLLIGFLNVLPTFMPLFLSSRGLPTIELRFLEHRDVTRFLMRLRDSSIKELRSMFKGARVIGLQPLYVNEPVTWREIDYPRPWLPSADDPIGDRQESTSFDMAIEIEENLRILRRSVLTEDEIESRLTAGTVVANGRRLVLETDVVIVGSGAGGSIAAAEIAERTGERVLVLEKGDFLEPHDFVEREQRVVPRVYDVEFSAVNVPVLNKQVPTMATTVVRGKLVGGSATINHGLAFETPKPVLRDWKEQFGAEFTYDDLKPHFEAVRTMLRIQPVPDIQVSGNNYLLRKGAEALGLAHHGVSDRNAHQCHGCGFCDIGCRYNRKLTPLNVILPRAARHGAQVIANCSVERVELQDSGPEARATGRLKKARGVLGRLTSARGEMRREIEVRAERVVVAAGPLDSTRILLRSGVNDLRAKKGSERSVGQHFSCHAPVTFYAEFDEPFYPSVGGPPMSYFCKVYDNQENPDPERDHIIYAIEGIFNHPMTHAQLMPFESPEDHFALMKKFNRTMTLVVLFKDEPVGRITEKAFDYDLPKKDRPRYLESIRLGARLMFAAGARRVFFSDARPLVLRSPDEIDAKLTTDRLDQGQVMFTSGHPMGGCALGGDPRRAVVDSYGRSWDVENLYVSDSSIFPTSLGANPCFTTYALSHLISGNMVSDLEV